ncbi:MAG: hypothetical protein CVU34_20730 [Betaproteobacteria bacterium HGW-Betaproteobacteria-7]|jgi:hypothetical protein|nr:MAG: hypothetical protein CVU34_20730 [Betaproteobacteria bacterium HGW-Betaproteobacteria-7]
MDLGGLTIGMREGVIVLITLVVAYIVIVLWRMLALRRRASVAVPEVVAPPPVATASVSSETLVPPVAEPVRPAPPADSSDQRPGRSSEQFERQRLEQEVFQLRDEVDTLRGELSALRQDMLREFAHLQAAQAVSPIYGDAMQMAVAGYDPAVIAERCGIARAEAELVVALAKSQEP